MTKGLILEVMKKCLLMFVLAIITLMIAVLTDSKLEEPFKEGIAFEENTLDPNVLAQDVRDTIK